MKAFPERSLMKKIEFEDKSYVEVSKSNQPNKIFISIAAKDANNTHKLVVNSVELTVVEFLALTKSVN